MDTRFDEHYLNIGRIVSNFQHLELSLQTLIWYLLDIAWAPAQMVTSNISFNRLCTLLQGLFKIKIKDPELIEVFEDVLRRASQAEEKRNLAVHSSLVIGDYTLGKTALGKNIARFRIKLLRNKGLSVRLDTLTAEDMLKDASFIGKVADDCLKLNINLIQIGLVKEKISEGFSVKIDPE